MPAKNTVDIGLSKLPEIIVFDSDRTGQAQSPLPETSLNSALLVLRRQWLSRSLRYFPVWAAGLEKFINIFEERINKGEDAIDAALCTIREVSKMNRKIRFEGDAYSAEWHAEAERRGIVKPALSPKE